MQKESQSPAKIDYSKQLNKLEKRCNQAMGADRFALCRQVQQLKRQQPKAKNQSPDDSNNSRKDRFSERITALEKRIESSAAARQWRLKNRPRPTYDENLPIVAKKDEIIGAIRNHPVVVISGETGSGKTTQLPKFCLEAGRGVDGMIGCTQPRRIAAMTVASRIAEELNEELGQSVGYKIRFTDQTGDRAFIKMMTDGILLAEAQGDRWLNGYDTIIVDEAHERSLNIDFVLGILKTLVKKRRDLKLIITSATIDTEKFSKAFDDAPVIEVSGRMYPVDVRYMPPEEESDDLTHVDMAVRSIDRLQQESPYGGDILVFMPTEQDIRETCELLEARNHTGVTVLPLFARLSAGDQSRAFAKVPGRKIIVSTNVAETSITIPGIRFVIDTGLARISQYSPRTRTTGLPVSPISRSSADQRKGRCGRVANGICIRLYSEDDYESRPRFTPPEILRSNLAEVILRMIALRLGDIADFPFIDRPAEKNIQDGFRLLEELGAIRLEEMHRRRKLSGEGSDGDAESQTPEKRYILTERGRTMARLPLDPRLSRMLLAAGERGCLDEMTVIAAALSIQDPRERPSEKRKQADQAHARFKDTRSDFLTLLNIWKIYHKEREARKTTSRKTTRTMRRFCAENFLSFKRMREWRDTHYQIRTILEEQEIKNTGSLPTVAAAEDGFSPLFTSVHQSILAGFLSNIANRTEANFYKASKDRTVMLFPGSGLYNGGAKWIVAAEVVETSRVFARMAAGIDPDWLEPIGGEQCRYTYLEPHWEKNRGEVVAYEQVTLYGLLIVPRRPVSYGPISPTESRHIFIRSALVHGELKQQFPFMAHNKELIDHVRLQEDKVRRRDLLVSEEDLFAFYDERIPEDIYDAPRLKRFLKQRKSDKFLRMREEDLYLNAPDRDAMALYPDKLPLGNTVIACEYVFEPGATNDGVTLKVPSAVAPTLPAEALDWLVPGLLGEKIAAMIRALPKDLRKQLVPVNQTVEVIEKEMVRNERRPLISVLGEFIYKRFGVDIPASAWSLDELPDHLKLRVSIRGPGGEEIRAGRDTALLTRSASNKVDPDRFENARKQWEISGITGWEALPDLPETVTLKGEKGEKWVAYPGLRLTGDELSLHLFDKRPAAIKSHKKGIVRLFSLRFAQESRALRAKLKLPGRMALSAKYFGSAKALETAIYDRVRNDLFSENIRTREAFEAHAAAVGPKIAEAGKRLLDQAVRVIDAFQECREKLYELENANRFNAGIINFLSQQRDLLANLVPENFVSLYDPSRMAHLDRYVRAITLRAERGVVNFDKDQARARDVKRYNERLRELIQSLSANVTEEKRNAVEEFFWMIEEFKVSLFAQELKTPYPVSPKRLDKAYSEILRMV